MAVLFFFLHFFSTMNTGMLWHLTKKATVRALWKLLNEKLLSATHPYAFLAVHPPFGFCI